MWVCLQLKAGVFSFFRLKTVAHFVPIRSMLKMRVQPTRNFILIILRWWKWLQGKEVHLSNLCKFNWDHSIPITLSPQISWNLLWIAVTTESYFTFYIKLPVCFFVHDLFPCILALCYWNIFIFHVFGLAFTHCMNLFCGLKAEEHSVFNLML